MENENDLAKMAAEQTPSKDIDPPMETEPGSSTSKRDEPHGGVIQELAAIDPNADVLYLCPKAPVAKTRIGKTRVQAVAGVLKLSPELAKEFDALMKTRLDLRAMFRKVDVEAATKQIRAHQEQMRQAAVSGVTTSSASAEARVRREQAKEAARQVPANIGGKVQGNKVAQAADPSVFGKQIL